MNRISALIYFFVLAIVLALVFCAGLSYLPSDDHQPDDAYSVERKYVSSHSCEVLHKTTIGTHLDINSGKVMPPETFIYYQCEGVDVPILVKDLPQ